MLSTFVVPQPTRRVLKQKQSVCKSIVFIIFIATKQTTSSSSVISTSGDDASYSICTAEPSPITLEPIPRPRLQTRKTAVEEYLYQDLKKFRFFMSIFIGNPGLAISGIYGLLVINIRYRCWLVSSIRSKVSFYRKPQNNETGSLIKI